MTLWALSKTEEPLTAQQIADPLRLERKRITDAPGYWYKNKYGYTQRMKRQEEGKGIV